MDKEQLKKELILTDREIKKSKCLNPNYPTNDSSLLAVKLSLTDFAIAQAQLSKLFEREDIYTKVVHESKIEGEGSYFTQRFILLKELEVTL